MRSFKEELGAGEWGTDELANKYKKETPGQKIEESKIDILRNMMAGVDKIDPSGAAYTKLKNYMKSLDDKNLQMIAKANIKFMSNLANTEMKSRKTQKESADKEKDIEDLMKMIKNPDPKRVKEYGGKDEYVSMLKDKVKKLMKEAYIGEDVNEETLNEAVIRRLLSTNSLYKYFSGVPKVTGLNPNDVIGTIWDLKSVKGYSELYLWNLDTYDKSITKHIKLKSGEKIFRYATHTTAAGDLKPMIKVNVAKSLAYFLKQDDGEYMDPPEFESSGVKFRGIQLTEDGAKGLDISNWTEVVRESNDLTNDIERQLFERLAQDDAYVDRDYDVVKKEWDKAKDKNKVIQKYGLKSAFSNLRGGEIKLGISNELKTRPKRKIAALDGDKLIYVTGWPMKIHFHEEFVNESMNIEKMLKNLEMEISEDDAINLFSELSINKSLMKKIKEMPSYKDGQKAKNINDNPYGKSNSSKGSVNYWIWNYGFDDEIL